METLIIYTVALLVSIAIIYSSILYVQKIENKSTFFIAVLLTSSFIFATNSVFTQSDKIVDATKVNIVAPDGFYSDNPAVSE